MLTVYLTAEYILTSVNYTLNYTYPRTDELITRMELLKRMLMSVPPEQLVAVDEELFKFLGL